MELTYTKNGDYLIPDLKMDEQPEGELGKYGRMRQKYLKEHRSGMYTALMLDGKLWAHLMEIDQAANSRMEQITKDLAKQRGVTEALKANDQMRWVQEMNNIQMAAEEIVRDELIYS
ncbi:Transposon-encoded protein TnpV [Caprobacter fermentans]|uniref:Transposon-encoded protein TnpV n=1 Tax=Caproicibacter fermentans TaxID=2576756 RepID=A0A6N8HY88_9FIRM|nr:TnpV protein [Caproicibacter fermentans]MVB10437.1 Transposon-encoded protein TnpV [Caproicibacter fermentans]